MAMATAKERPLSSRIMYTLYKRFEDTGELQFIDLGRRISRLISDKEALALEAIKHIKITSKEQIAEIYTAKIEMVQLDADWLAAIRDNQQEKAANIRRRSNKIKRDIRLKYDILLD